MDAAAGPPPPPPRWTLRHGDILDVAADALVCSANVQLNLSGGVGGAILLRYGDAMQRELRRHLADRGAHHVPPGTVVRTGPGGTPFRDVFHAVAVDAFYHTDDAALSGTILAALDACAAAGARTVALAALATGYGRFPPERFAAVVRDLSARPFPPVESVAVCVESDPDYAALRAAWSIPDPAGRAASG